MRSPSRPGLRPLSELSCPGEGVPGDEDAAAAESEKIQKNRVKHFVYFFVE
jgi:hypothetical protein